MKKYLFLLIVLILFFPIYVEADTDCGKYKSSLSTSVPNADVKIEGTTVKLRIPVTSISTWSRVSGSTSECPSAIYCVCGGSTCDFDVCYLDENSYAYHIWTPVVVPEPEPEPVTPEASDKYKDIISCRQTDYNYISECGCMPAALTDLTSRLYMLIKIAAPALLLIIGGFDLVKAMSAQDESAINKARQKLVKKFIAAAAVFLIFTLVQFIVSTLANDSRTTMTCVDYLLNGYVA